MSNLGSSLRIQFTFVPAANANAKLLKIYLGGVALATLYTSSANVANNVGTVDLLIRVRSYPTSIELLGIVTADAASGVAPGVKHFRVTSASIDWSVNQVFKVTGQGAASSDLTLTGWLVEFLP